MNELLKLKAVTSDKDVKELRRFYDALENHIRSLLSLDVDSKSYGSLLTPIIMERLPPQVRLILSRELKDKGWDLSWLQSTLSDELLARESCTTTKTTVDYSYESETTPYSSSALFTKSKQNKRKVKCAFCNGNYVSDKCMTVTEKKSY